VPRYFIDVPHDPDPLACAKVIHVFLTTGSHFLSQADWGCSDGVHSAWLTVEVGSKDEALAILPPAFRAAARVTRLTRFRLEDIEPILRRHGAIAPAGEGGHAG
jgi:hypothetical protein